jgi:hypothetical protein
VGRDASAAAFLTWFVQIAAELDDM